jgi:hypothetical protein
MITCPLCGRKECGHTIADLGLTTEEFLIFDMFKEDNLEKQPKIKAEFERVKKKLEQNVESFKGSKRS